MSPLAHLRLDLIQAVRALGRRPGLAFTAVATLPARRAAALEPIGVLKEE